MEKESIKKEILIDLILEKLYRCLSVEKNKVVFDRYNLNEEDMQYILKELDEERYKVYCEMLLNKKED